MSITRTATGRAAVALLLCTGLAACAQPGQLGSPLPSATPEPTTAAPAPPEPAKPGLLGQARLDTRVTIRTQGAAQYSVRTIVLEPGSRTEWLRNPGSEIAAVQSGGIVLQQQGEEEGSCVEAPYAAGQAYSVPDGVPYRIRNDGSVPAELLVTRLFAPTFPEPELARAACHDGPGGESG